MVSGTPVVSVLVTVYNRERYLREALLSVLDSTYTDYEVIVVDDCSTDRSFEIANDVANSNYRIRVFRNEHNLGDYPNRMRAASLAQGRYIKYVDSDDLIYPHSLAIIVESMEKYPSAALALSHSMPEDESPYPWCLTPEEAYRKHFQGRGCLSCGPSGAMIRRDAFESVGGFRPQWKVLSDADLWFRLAARWPIVLLPPALVWWRRHEQQEFTRDNAASVYLRDGYELSKQALMDSGCPLTEPERVSALHRAKQHFARKLWSMAFRSRRFGLALSALRDSDLSMTDLAKGIRPYRQ